MNHLPVKDQWGNLGCSCGEFKHYPQWVHDKDIEGVKKRSRETRLKFREHVREAQQKEQAAAECERRRKHAEELWKRRAARLKAKPNRPSNKSLRRWKRLDHRSWSWRRTLFMGGDLERAFADAWEQQCQPEPGLNQGRGTAQNLMFDSTFRGIFHRHRLIAELDNRDAMIAATIVQWLGTNCGFCFLRETLRKCGYEISERRHNEQGTTQLVEFFLSIPEKRVLEAIAKNQTQRPIWTLAEDAKMPVRIALMVFQSLCNLGIAEWADRAPAGSKEWSRKKLVNLTRLGKQICDTWNVREVPGRDELCEVRAYVPEKIIEQLRREFRILSVKSVSCPGLHVPYAKENFNQKSKLP